MITSIARDFTNSPFLVRILTTDTFNTITTSGYIAAQQENIRAINNGDFEWESSDFILIYYSNGQGMFTRDSSTNAFVPITASEGYQSFTPTISFETPGNLSVVYAFQSGQLITSGPVKFANISLSFTPTHTTAAGELEILGIPVPITIGMGGIVHTVSNANLAYPTSKTALVPRPVNGSSIIQIFGQGTAQADVALSITQITTATAFAFQLLAIYI